MLLSLKAVKGESLSYPAWLAVEYAEQYRYLNPSPYVRALEMCCSVPYILLLFPRHRAGTYSLTARYCTLNYQAHHTILQHSNDMLYSLTCFSNNRLK